MDTFTRDGLTFDVRDAGPEGGEPVVLLHGFPQDAGAFDRLAPALHTAGLRTLAPDQRGYSPGARPAGRAAYRLRAVVDDAVALLDAAGLPSAHVVGHDWGGFVGWALGAWHPARVRTLTVLSVPHPGAFTQALWTSPQALRSGYMGFFQLPALPERALLARGGAPLRRLLVGSGLPAADADRYVARMREPGALSAALAWYRALPWDARDPIGRVAVPTLLAWGTRDGALDRAGVEATGRFVRGPYRLEVLDDAGHWLPETAAERLAPMILQQAKA